MTGGADGWGGLARWIGLVASCGVAWGACSPGFAHAGSWQQPVIDGLGAWLPSPVAELMIVAGVIGICWAWWQSRAASVPQLLTSFWLWSLPLWFGPPVLSADLTLYADTGYVVAAGANPYLVGLGGLGGPLAAALDPLWAGHGVAYPPLTLMVNGAMVSLAGAHPYWSLVALRLPVLVGIVLMMASVARLAHRFGVAPGEALWLGVVNPLVLVHFVGGGHNDALMVGVAMVALVAACDWHWWFGAIIVGVAMALKQQAGLMVVATAGVPLAGLAGVPLATRIWRLGWRSAVSAALAVLVFVGVSMATGLDFGWVSWLGEMGRTGTIAPVSLISQAAALLGTWFGFSASNFIAVMAILSNLAVVVALAWVLWRFVDRPLAAVGWGALALAVLGQSLHPWYVVWGIACIGLTALTAKQRMTQVWFIIVFIVWNAIQTVIWHSMPEWYVP